MQRSEARHAQQDAEGRHRRGLLVHTRPPRSRSQATAAARRAQRRASTARKVARTRRARCVEYRQHGAPSGALLLCFTLLAANTRCNILPGVGHARIFGELGVDKVEI